jgi:hypothetical protein
MGRVMGDVEEEDMKVWAEPSMTDDTQIPDSYCLKKRLLYKNWQMRNTLLMMMMMMFTYYNLQHGSGF